MAGHGTGLHRALSPWGHSWRPARVGRAAWRVLPKPLAPAPFTCHPPHRGKQWEPGRRGEGSVPKLLRGSAVQKQHPA